MTPFLLPPVIRECTSISKFISSLTEWSTNVDLHVDRKEMNLLQQEAVSKWRKRVGGYPHEQIPYGQLDHVVLNHVRHNYTWYDSYTGIMQDEDCNPTWVMLKYLTLRSIQKVYPELSEACQQQWRVLNKDVELEFGNSLRAVAISVTKGFTAKPSKPHEVFNRAAAHRPFQHLNYMLSM